MRKIIKIVLYFFAGIVFNNSNAQDLHFSQYFNAPLLVNPANTGFNPEFDYRLGANHRNQWANVTNFPYKTSSVWADAQLFNNRFENGWMGVGGALLQDVAGSANLTSTKAYGSVAYHQLVGMKSLISGGFNIGLTQKRIDPTKLNFNSQWNGKFFDVTIPSGEPINFTSVTYFTLQAGINYANFFSDNLYFNVGLSMANINRPNETFFAVNTADNRVDARYTAFANASIKLQDVWILNPNVYVSKMGTATEVVFGGMLQRDLSAERNGSLQLLAGAYYRVGDAVIPNVGFEIKNVKITINYDATFSSLRAYNQSNGAYEISIVKNGLYKGREKSLKCPPTVRF